MDTYIDPTTRAYVADPGRPGQLMRDPTGGLLNACYLRLSIPLGTYWAAPSIGSRLHELNGAKATTWIQDSAEQYARNALQPLVDDGRAKDLVVSSELQVMTDGSKRLALAIEIANAAGQVVAFPYFVKVA